MRKFEDYGLYVISLVFAQQLVSALIAGFSASQPSLILWQIQKVVGAYPSIYLTLVLAASISLFVTYKFRWITILLPFLWKLFLPVRNSVGESLFTSGYYGSVIEALRLTTIPNWSGVWFTLWSANIELVCVVYLFLKFIKEYDSKKFEISFVSILLLLVILRLF